MPTLAWTAAGDPDQRADEQVVMASRFDLRSWRDVAPFFVAALKIRRQMLRSSGNLGVSLIARPAGRTFYTLSSWRDREALDRAVTQQPHLATMQRFRGRTNGSVFAFWSVPPGQPHPEWGEAHRRLRAQTPKDPPAQGS